MAYGVEQAVYEYLTTDSAFMANFSGVYWIEADKTVDPYIVFWLVDDNGATTEINKSAQGEARIQFDLWIKNKIQGAEYRTLIADKVRDLNETIGDLYVRTDGINETTVQRASGTDPFHFVVDGIIKWNRS